MVPSHYYWRMRHVTFLTATMQLGGIMRISRPAVKMSHLPSLPMVNVTVIMSTCSPAGMKMG
jgi:hypothetical protein